MKKLTKLGIASISVFVLNTYTHTIVKADENRSSETSVTVELSTTQANAPQGEHSIVTNNGSSSAEDNVPSSDGDYTLATTTSETTRSTATPPKSNIVNEDGYVNIEGHPAALTDDGESVVYSYTVAFKGMHSSDRVQTVRDIRLRIPDIPGAKVDFTLIGTRDANENPVPVNVPMKVILPDEIVSDSDTDPTTTLNSDSSVVPTAEELRAGKKPAIVNMDANENGYPGEHLYPGDGIVHLYGISSKTLNPFHPAELCFGARGRFFARAVATDAPGTVEILKAAMAHKGASVCEILQNCVIFNNGTHDSVAKKEDRAKNAIYLKHGEPMLFGENNEYGLMQEGFGLKVVKLGENGITEKDILIHDAHCMDNTLQLKLALMEGPDFPIALGVIRDVEAPTYDDAVHEQIEEVSAKKKYHNFEELLMTNDTWEVK